MHEDQAQENVLNKWIVVNSNTIGIIWVQGRAGEWTQSQYNLSKQRLCWRGHVIEMEAKATRNYFGATVVFDIIHDGNKYKCLFTQFKYMVGSHGDQLPVIGTDTHRLHIRTYVSGITLSDIPLNENFVGTKDSFEILNRL
jgi:hypothetical protein